MGRQVRVLLDTHAFLWAAMQPERLSPKAHRLLETAATEVLISAASAWEIATKFRLGKLPGAKSAIADYGDVVRRLGAQSLSITTAHALTAGSYPHEHRDPFDRLLAAQAQIEGLTLVSKDRALGQFGIKILW